MYITNKKNWLDFIKNIYIIIILSTILCAIDLQYISNECLQNIENKVYPVLLILGHHFIATFLNFGFLFNNKIFLTLFIIGHIITIIHWLTNRNKCFITLDLNKICNYPKDRLFPDFFWMIGLKKYNWWNQWGSYIFYILTVFIAFFKIIY